MRTGRQKRLGPALVFAAFLGLIGYVASDAVRGAHGLIVNQLLRSRIAALRAELGLLKAQRVRFERDAELLGAKAASQPALLDVQVRELLNFANQTDIVIVNDEKTEH